MSQTPIGPPCVSSSRRDGRDVELCEERGDRRDDASAECCALLRPPPDKPRGGSKPAHGVAALRAGKR